uniref:Apple domain-containing protein n=1 Tax=Alexandrium catenella TaxID=2925 RepID=A0A7S1W3E2_ALECA
MERAMLRATAMSLFTSMAVAQMYPDCVENRVVMRHAGAHAIFVDLSSFGTSGCWQNDCKSTDKFNAVDHGICARACAAVDQCTHWSFGEQEGATKCFLRKSDGGREEADGWTSSTGGCAPPPVPDAWAALAASEVEELKPCDAGKSEACPDMAKAMNTWKYAIASLQRATDGQLDANTMQYINQIASDTDAFSAQMSEENFPVVIGNNRQVFNALRGWLEGQSRADVDPNDPSLPNPLKGRLCGATSCYE